jgi:uncharacterized caspase-like protein
MRHWAIIVGLNEYQFFQPLTCAQQDAHALHQFLVHQAGFSPEHCLLMSDASSPTFNRSTLPTRANVQAWIDLFAQHHWQPGDALCFFFSGYGIHHRGTDYLVPLDGSLSAVEATCLSVSDLFNCFRAALPLGDIAVLLDISRSQQGALTHATVGIQTAQLANYLEIPTLLSCQPGQFSREVSSLGHGLFAHGVLEALQYQPDINLALLTQYLGDRLPELSEHYWQPSQHPVLICPSAKLYQPLLPSKVEPAFAAYAGNGAGNGSAANGNGSYAGASGSPASVRATSGSMATFAAPNSVPTAATTIALQQSGFYSPGTLQNSALLDDASAVGHNGKQSSTFPSAPTSDGREHRSMGSFPHPVIPVPISQIPPSAPPNSTELYAAQSDSDPIRSDGAPSDEADDDALEMPEGASWRPIFLWGGLLSVGLISCVMWRNWAALWFPNPAIAQNGTALLPPSYSSTEPLRQVPVSAGASGVMTVPAPSSSAQNPLSTQNPLPAQNSLNDNAAQNQALSFNPIPAPIASSSSPLAGQVILNQARAMVLSDQATPYRDAIRQAKRVPANDPAYGEAQQDIAVWSQTIWTIAQRRAAQKRLDVAIMAADLVPGDNSTLHPQAQAAIAQWCPIAQASRGDSFAAQQAKIICNRQPI